MRAVAPTTKVPATSQDESLITYLVLSGLESDISETQIINAIAPHIRVYVSTSS
jgi:hypothetical protein